MNKTRKVSLIKQRKRSNKLQAKAKLETPIIETRTPIRTAQKEVVETTAALKKTTTRKTTATTKKSTVAKKSSAPKKTTTKKSTANVSE